MVDIYTKTPDAPLPAPEEATAVSYQQLPENVMYLTGVRGFKKRPGSVKFAKILRDTNSNEAVFTLGTVPTPITYNLLSAPIQTDPAPIYTALTFPATTVLTGRFLNTGTTKNAFYALQKRRVVNTVSASDIYLSRDPSDEANINYAYKNIFTDGSIPFTVTVTPSTTIGDLALPAGIHGGDIDVVIDTSLISNPAITAAPSNFKLRNLDNNKNYLMAHAALPVFGSAAAQFSYGFNSITTQAIPALRQTNVGRLDYMQLGGSVFIAGCGGTVYNFDVYRTYVAGAASGQDTAINVYGFTKTKPFSDPSVSATAGGTLSGTYLFQVTNKITLPSGEIIEGVPTRPASVLVNGGNGSVNITGTTTPALLNTYRNTEWSTSTAGSTTTIVLNESHDLQIGEQIAIFLGGSSIGQGFNGTGRYIAIITAINGQSITFATTVGAVPAFSGTSYITTGGGFIIYRTKGNGTIFFQTADLSPSQYAGTYADSLSDTLLGQNPSYAAAAVVQLPPPGSNTNSYVGTNYGSGTVQRVQRITTVVGGVVHQSRLCVLDTNNTVSFTSAISAYYWDPGNSFTLEGKTPIGVASVQDILYVFFSDRIYYVQGSIGTDLTQYTVHLLTDQLGCRDPKSIIRTGSDVWFVSSRGLRKLTGATISSIEGLPIQSLITQLGVVTATYYWNTKGLLLISANMMQLIGPKNDSYDSGFPPYLNGYQYYDTVGPPTTLVYDLNAQKWSKWTLDIFNGATEYEGDLLYVPKNTPNESSPVWIYRLSDGCNWTDDFTPFTTRYFTRWYDDGEPGVDKSYNRLAVYSTDTLDLGKQNFTLNIRTEKNWQRGLQMDTFVSNDFTAGKGYGELPYATTLYGDIETSVKIFPLSNQKVKSIRAVLENNQPNADICINAVEIESAEKYANMKDI